MDTERGVLNTGVYWEEKGRASGRVRRLGRDNGGEMPGIGDEGMEAANQIAMYGSMQQSCMFCTCTLEPKVQLYIYIKCCYICLQVCI